MKIGNFITIIKNKLETIYDHTADGIRIRSKCEWYEHGKKSTKFFLNLEKKASRPKLNTETYY